MTVILGTLAQETAVTILAPFFAIPPASASLPTIKPEEYQVTLKSEGCQALPSKLDIKFNFKTCGKLSLTLKSKQYKV